MNIEDDSMEIKDSSVDEREQKVLQEDEIVVLDENNEIIDGIEIIKDPPKPKMSKKWIIMMLILITLIAGSLTFYFYMKNIMDKKEKIDIIIVNTNKDDLGNTFMDILNKNNYTFNGNNSYDITINYGKIEENIDLSIKFSSKNCFEAQDPNCSLFNKKKLINVIINENEYKYYNGYNNSYDVIEGILKNSYIALLNNTDEIYFINNSDTVETYELDQISKPSINIFNINEENNSTSYMQIITKYINQNDNYESCPVIYDKEEKSLTYCINAIIKDTIYGKGIEFDSTQYISGKEYYKETNSNTNCKYDMPELTKKGKDINELNNTDIKNLTDYVYNYYNSIYDVNDSIYDGTFYTDKEANIDNINNYFIVSYLLNIYSDIGKKVESCDELSKYFDDDSIQIKECKSTGTIMNHLYKVYNYDEINDFYKKYFNTTKDLPKDTYETKYSYYKYVESQNHYISDVGGRLGPGHKIIQRIDNYETDGDVINIYVRTLLHIRNNESNTQDSSYIYARGNSSKLLARKNSICNYSNEEYNELFEKGQLYKFTFTKNSNDKYYWVSTKPI